jgi:hypothetical protein
MKSLQIELDYLPIEALVAMIDEPNRLPCQRILTEHRCLFEHVHGSTHNHQTWSGGYIDHVTDCMNFIRHLFTFVSAFGRPMPFTLSDALLVIYLHDLEKPWRFLVNQDRIANRVELSTKAQRKQFREDKLREYGIYLTPYQLNAFTYVEGELDDYSSTRRVMNELGAFCHMVDVWSARGWYDYPKPMNDGWVGADRVRTC